MTTVGYGTDTYCDDRLRSGRLSRGIVTVGLSALHRLTTPRGVVRIDAQPANFGIDLSEYVGALGTDDAVAIIPSAIRAELAKDDRIASVDVDVRTEDVEAGGVRVVPTIRITGHGSDVVYEFSLSVSDEGVDVLATRVIA